MEKEVRHHYPIIRSFSQRVHLFISMQLSCLKKYNCASTKRMVKFKKLYEIGHDKIEAELSVERIVNSLKNLKILIKNKFLDDHLKFQI